MYKYNRHGCYGFGIAESLIETFHKRWACWGGGGLAWKPTPPLNVVMSLVEPWAAHGCCLSKRPVQIKPHRKWNPTRCQTQTKVCHLRVRYSISHGTGGTKKPRVWCKHKLSSSFFVHIPHTFHGSTFWCLFLDLISPQMEDVWHVLGGWQWWKTNGNQISWK